MKRPSGWALGTVRKDVIFNKRYEMKGRDPFSCLIIGEGTLPMRCAELLLHRGLKINGIISSDAAITHALGKGKRDAPY
jgi:hypothetical protein